MRFVQIIHSIFPQLHTGLARAAAQADASVYPAPFEDLAQIKNGSCLDLNIRTVN